MIMLMYVVVGAWVVLYVVPVVILALLVVVAWVRVKVKPHVQTNKEVIQKE